jgi:hypothetical protein
MKVVLYRPSSEKISSTTPEQVGFDFKPTDCLRLILNLQYMYLTNKGKCEDGFVELCSTVLQSIVHDYRKYMEWMIQENIISVHNHYIVGEKCRSYRLNYPFDPELVDDRERFVQIHIPVKSKSQKQPKPNSIRGLGFLKSSLSGLTIDDRLAYDISEKIYQEDLIQPRKRMKKGKHRYYEVEVDPLRSLQYRKDGIVSIGMKDFYIHRDHTSGRVHSNLTSFTSKLFSTLKYKGQPLVGYDIANSQPFLASVLLRFIFSPMGVKRGFNIKSLPKPLLHYIHTYTKHSLQLPLITIMLEESLSEADFTGVSEFQLLCENGDLYKVLSPKLFDVTYTARTQRKIKDFFFTLLFTKPTNNKNGIKQFREAYPMVHRAICEVKRQSSDEHFFPKLLQCMESYFILECVCKRLHKEYPKAPVFTKHDSVYTIEEYRLELLKIMQEESLVLFGVSPTFRLC